MYCLSWNCRGLGQSRTIRELVCLVQTHKPRLLFLSETRQECEYVRKLKWRFGMKNCFTVKGEGKGGGLVLFWEEGMK
ncbi:hypothetical protein BRADI_4g10074v3, partial [Brachypodium distachyon]